MADVSKDYFNGNTLARDLFDIMCRDQLGSGIGRVVFEMRGDPTKVIKFEVVSQSFQNVIEWETWESLSSTKEAKWLAPCTRISACGTVLIMERTSPIPTKYKLPTHVPAFLSDFKRDNYGLLNGRLVCHDYGTNIAISRGAGKAMCVLGKRLSE